MQHLSLTVIYTKVQLTNSKSNDYIMNISKYFDLYGEDLK